MYCLHAAAVSVDGRAHVLVGASGAGKSTLSIRLARNGAQLLGDDCAAILAGWVYPTYRPGRVWPASLVRLGLQEMSPDASGKVLLDERHGVRIARSPVPLATVVLVGTRPRCLALDEALHVIVGQRFHLSLRPPRVLFDEGVRLLRESGPINEIDRDSWLPLGDPRMGSRCLTNANQSVLNQVIDEP
jgi:hypothetical protein